MEELPASIELYLRDAGFTLVELMIIRKLLAEDGQTLRQLSAKTGKSTGALDGAMKRLVRKRIVTKETRNGNPCFFLHSLKRLEEWTAKDMREKKEALQRRHQDFTAFLSSIKHRSDLPEMEHFKGKEGLQLAYERLLTSGAAELLRFLPSGTKEEHHPLHGFLKEWDVRRRRADIALRVLTHDTVEGKGYAHRDTFEKRETKLIPEHRLPIPFERIVAGDTVVCFDFAAEQACLIRYADMAKSEAALFDSFWHMSAKDLAEVAPPAAPSVEQRMKETLRSFFLQKSSLLSIVVSLLVAAGITGLLYQRNIDLNTERIRERVTAIASTGADYFDADDLKQLRTLQDSQTPVYAKVVNQLEDIRQKNTDIWYVYLIRPTNDNGVFTFVADADAPDPYAELDTNFDGTVDSADALGYPGRSYDVFGSDVLINREYTEPIANRAPYTDQWGSFMTGYAPIYDATNNLEALLAVDMDATKIYSFSASTFSPVVWLFGLFVLLLLLRFWFLHAGLVGEFFRYEAGKRVIRSIVICSILSAIVTGAIEYRDYLQARQRIQDYVTSIAATAALQFEPSDLALLRTADDISRPEYAKVIGQLNRVRDENPTVKYAYIMRKTNSPEVFAFVADADSIDPYAPKDLNGDGIVDEADWLSPPGEVYTQYTSNPPLSEGFVRPTPFEEYEDQWGRFISAWAPIRDDTGNVVAAVGIDISIDEVRNIQTEQISTINLFLLVLAIFLGLYALLLTDIVSPELRHMYARRLLIIVIIIVFSLSLLATYLLHSQAERLIKQQMGERIMSIASTSADRFSTEDLNSIRVARDMKSEEYQRIFAELNRIRDLNPDIKYVYIWRKTDIEGIWEFVADADSNYNLPFNGLYDLNDDGRFSDADENLAPGVRYDIQTSSPDLYKSGMMYPIYEDDWTVDQWGTFITGGAPIENGIYLIGLDIDVDRLKQKLNHELKSRMLILLLFITISTAIVWSLRVGIDKIKW